MGGPEAGTSFLDRRRRPDRNGGRGTDGLALLLYKFDPSGGEGEREDVVGGVGEGFLEGGLDEGLSGARYGEALEREDDVSDGVEDGVGVVGGVASGERGGGGAQGVLVRDDDAERGGGEARVASERRVVDGEDVDERAWELDVWLRQVELAPVAVDVTQGGDEGGKARLEGEENLFHFYRLLSVWSMVCFIFSSMARERSG